MMNSRPRVEDKMESLIREVMALKAGMKLDQSEAEAILAVCMMLISFSKASVRVASLNPKAGEIGDGMLATIVSEARAAFAFAGYPE